MSIKRFKRFVSIFLALVMIVGTLTSCGLGEQGIRGEAGETGLDGKEDSSTESVDIDEETKLPPAETPETDTEDDDIYMMQNAKTVYLEYIAENADADSEFMVYESDGSFVAIHNGEPVGVYASLELALKDMVGEEADTTKLTATDNRQLFIYGDMKVQPEFLADVYMIPCYGQSLSTNTSAGSSTFKYIDPLSYDVRLKNNNVQDMCAGTAEGFRLMAEYCGVELPENFKIISCTGGAGGKSVQQLSKGTTYYNNVIKSIKAAKSACDAQGLTMIVPCFTWTQGEEDMRAGGNAASYGIGTFDPYKYKNRLKKLIDDFNADIKAITGQTTDVLCISYQVASHTTYARYPRIAMQQQELAMEDDRMILAKIMYDVDYVTEGDSVPKYQVHAPAATYRNMGNMYGIAAFRACVLKEKVEWVHPIEYRIDGNKVYIKFEVPHKPLTLDDVLVENLPDGNYGFQIYRVDEQIRNKGSIELGGTKITKVELIGDDTVMLTLSQAPLAGETLTYGINGDFWQNINGSKTVLTGGEGRDTLTKSGRTYGSRGCLRDSQPIKNQNKGAVYQDLYNWCAIFEIPFTEENISSGVEIPFYGVNNPEA